MTPLLRVKGWSDFQHYKGRRPPWIKLHRQLLDDYLFHALPVASRALAPMIWLMASESEGGAMPFVPAELAFRLRMTEADLTAALNPLIDAGFLLVESTGAQCDSGPLAARLPDAMPEKSREEESREETETETASSSSAADSAPFEPADSVDAATYARRCTVACNRGLRENPAVGSRFNELVTSGQAAVARDWQVAGIAIDVAESTIYARALTYAPTGHNRQPRSLGYFGPAVVESWDRAQGRLEECRLRPRPLGTPTAESGDLDFRALAEAERQRERQEQSA